MVEGSGEEEDEEEEEEGEEGEEGEKRDPKAPLKKYPLYSKEGSILQWVESDGLVSLIYVRLLKYTDSFEICYRSAITARRSIANASG